MTNNNLKIYKKKVKFDERTDGRTDGQSGLWSRMNATKKTAKGSYYGCGMVGDGQLHPSSVVVFCWFQRI